MKKHFLLFAFVLFAVNTLCAQNNETNDTQNIVSPRNFAEEQQPETNPLILERLDEWQDLKFGFMAHWGIYSQWGVVESWSICSEPWISRNGANYMIMCSNTGHSIRLSSRQSLMLSSGHGWLTRRI